MRSARFNVSSAALLASVALASPSLVLAQTEPRTQSAAPPEAIETVIVTAQKRSERLLDVPVAVTSVSGTSLRNAGIADAASLERVAPSLTYATSLGTQYSSVKIRGVGALTTNSGVESSSAFIVDGIGLSRQGQGLSDLIDVASVEVLRGPQGTLFGKGTTAGAVLINMRRPSADLSILADATIAQGDEVRVSASVSGPLSPRVRARLTGFVTDVPGHVLNLYNGKMVNGSQSSGLRAKVEFDVTDSLNVLLSADYNDADSACCILIPRRSTNSVSRALQASVGMVPSTTNTTIWANGDIFNRDRHEGYTAEANLDLGDFKLTSLTGYKRWDTESNADGDNQGVVRPVYTVEVFTLTVSQLDRNFGRTELEQISQEFRLASPKDLPLNYVAGVYYGKSTIDRTADRRVGGCFPAPGVVFGAPCPNPVFRSTSQTSGTETTNYAAFGQLNWEATDRLTFLLGLRAQNEKTSFFGTRSLPTIPGDQPLSMPVTGKGDTEDSVVTGKVGASYKFAENLNTYFSYTRGYKGAAYDIELTANFAALKPLLPETVEAYELGLKWASPSGRFGANLAIYQSNFQNLQVETQQPVNGFLSFVLANTGAAKAQGLELEFFARPLPGLSLTGGYAYSDTAFDLDGSICYQLQPVQTLAPGAVPPGNTCYRYANDGPMIQARQNIRDGVLTSAPEHRFNITARFEAPINADFNWFAQSSVRYQSEVRFAIDQNPLSVEKPNAILDASVGIGRSNGRYQLSFFVKNLTNEFYSTGISIDQFVATTASPYELTHFVPKDAKRFFGVNLRFEY